MLSQAVHQEQTYLKTVTFDIGEYAASGHQEKMWVSTRN